MDIDREIKSAFEGHLHALKTAYHLSVYMYGQKWTDSKIRLCEIGIEEMEKPAPDLDILKEIVNDLKK